MPEITRNKKVLAKPQSNATSRFHNLPYAISLIIVVYQTLYLRRGEWREEATGNSLLPEGECVGCKHPGGSDRLGECTYAYRVILYHAAGAQPVCTQTIHQTCHPELKV